MDLAVRPEAAGEEEAIRELTRRAFAGVAYSDGSEPAIVDRLRADGDLMLSLVVVDGVSPVAHVAFSPVSIDSRSGGWFALGPFSVEPSRQNHGLGTRLAGEGLQRLRDRGAAGCVVVEDPAYYARFGFRSAGALHHPAFESRYVQWLALGDEEPCGRLGFAPAFGA